VSRLYSKSNVQVDLRMEAFQHERSRTDNWGTRGVGLANRAHLKRAKRSDRRRRLEKQAKKRARRKG
jgi:hypothetical protein